MSLRNYISVFILLLSIPLFAQNDGGKMVINGVYLGKNMYVQNPFNSNGVGFCTTRIEVNGQKADSCETGSSAYEIDLTQFHLYYGDSLHVIIYHHNDCKPKLLNPEAFFNHSDIFVNFWIDSAAAIHFITKDEGWTSYSYRVWQFRWGKWVQIGESMKCNGVNGHEYRMNAKPYLINGENRFQVTLPIPCGHFETKNSVIYNATVARVIYDSQSKCNTILFSHETLWELCNSKGDIVKKGFGSSVNYGELDERKYFTLNYDDRIVQVPVNRCYVPGEEQQGQNNSVVATRMIVYPNPAVTYFEISTGEELKGYSLIIEMIDLTGRVVLSQEIQGNSVSEIDVNGLADGVYIVRLKNGTEQLSSTKIAVHH